MAEQNSGQQQTGEDEGQQQTHPDANAGGNAGEDEGQQQGSTVNRHKYDRDLGKANARIKELEDQLKAKSGNDDALAQLQKRLDDMEAKEAAKAVEAQLKAAGCVDVELAAGVLGKYENDVEKLKAAKPNLFKSENANNSTGGSQKGNASAEDQSLKRLRKAMGLKD